MLLNSHFILFAPWRSSTTVHLLGLMVLSVTLVACATVEPRESPPEPIERRSPVINSVSPRTINPKAVPVTLRIQGTGFTRQSTIRLAPSSSRSPTFDLKPEAVSRRELSVRIEGEMLARLAKVGQLQRSIGLPSRPTKRPRKKASATHDYFQVAVVDESGTSSRFHPVGLIEPPAQIVSVSASTPRNNQPVTVMAARTLRIPVEIARSNSKMLLTVNADVFRVTEDGARVLVRGAGGASKIPPGAPDVEVEVSTPELEPSAEYEVSISIADCSSCIAPTVPLDVIENPEVTCPTCGPLFGATGVEIIAMDAQQETVGLRWVDNSVQEDGYRIEGRVGNNPWMEVTTVAAHQNTGLMEWTGAAPSWAAPHQACYRVVAYNTYDEIESEVDCGPPNAPKAPAWTRITNREAHSLTVEWLDNSTTEFEGQRSGGNGSPILLDPGFRLHRAYCEDCPYRTAHGTDGHADGTGPLRVTLGGLASDEDYCYKVEARNEYGSSWSPVVCGETLYEPPPPNRPRQLSIREKTKHSIKLRWRDYAHNEDGFYVQRRFPDDPWENHEHLSAKDGTGWMDWTDTGLQSNTTYCYRIKAYNEYGANFSGEKCATTYAGTPSTPNLVAGQVWIVEPTTPNQTFHLMYEVCNMGGPISDSFTDRVVQDGNLGAAKSSTHGPLGAYDCYNQSTTYQGGVPEGCYIWEVLVDTPLETGGSLQEMNEYDNASGLQACFW